MTERTALKRSAALSISSLADGPDGSAASVSAVAVGLGAVAGVWVGSGADVGVSVAVGVWVGARVGTGVDVDVSVAVGDCVGVNVGAGVDVGLAVAVGICVEVGVGGGVGVSVGASTAMRVGLAGSLVGVGAGPPPPHPTIARIETRNPASIGVLLGKSAPQMLILYTPNSAMP